MKIDTKSRCVAGRNPRLAKSTKSALVSIFPVVFKDLRGEAQTDVANRRTDRGLGNRRVRVRGSAPRAKMIFLDGLEAELSAVVRKTPEAIG